MKIIINTRRPHCIHLRAPLKFKPGYYHDPRMRRNSIVRRTKNGVLDEHGLLRKNFYFSLQARVSRTTGVFFLRLRIPSRVKPFTSLFYIIDVLIFFVFFSLLSFNEYSAAVHIFLTRRYYTN